MQESFWWWQCSDRYIISLFPRLHTPSPPLPHFSPSLISLMVSVNVKHHVYLRCLCILASHSQLIGFMVSVDVEHPVYLHRFCASWPLTISEILKRLAPLPILMQTHPGGDTAAWLCMKWHGAWSYGVHRTCANGSSFMWHQPCQRCKYTTSVDIQKRAMKSVSLM